MPASMAMAGLVKGTGMIDVERIPFDVALEIAGLKDYYETAVYPTTQTVWDLIVATKR